MEMEFKINEFEGPLDLLLHLIRSSKMDIYEINVCNITKQYLDFINKSRELSVDVASEYLEDCIILDGDQVIEKKAKLQNDGKIHIIEIYM